MLLHKLLLRYSFFVGTVGMLFSQFVACGTQFYQVDIKEDINEAALSNQSLDKTSPWYGIHAENGWQQLPIPFKIGTQLTEAQYQQIAAAISLWERAVGKQLFTFAGKDHRSGDSFRDLYSSLDDFINANYIDNNWDKTGKKSVVLGTAIWENVGSDISKIRTADLRFNQQYYHLGDAYILEDTDEKPVVDLMSLAIHEIGHLLGLTHIDADVDPYSVMNPTLYIGSNMTSRKLSVNDIKRIQKIYGCFGEACDAEALAEQMEYNTESTTVSLN